MDHTKKYFPSPENPRGLNQKGETDLGQHARKKLKNFTMLGLRLLKILIFFCPRHRQSHSWRRGPTPAAAPALSEQPAASRGGICARRPTFVSCSSTSPALAVLSPREEWCMYTAKAICTDSFSWRAHCRSRRSLLRRAAPSPPGSRSLMATARDTDKETRPTHWCCG